MALSTLRASHLKLDDDPFWRMKVSYDAAIISSTRSIDLVSAKARSSARLFDIDADIVVGG